MKSWKEAVCPSGQVNKCKSPGPSPRCCADLYDLWSMVKEVGGGRHHQGPVPAFMGSCRCLGHVRRKAGMVVNELSWAWAHRLSKEGPYRRWTRQPSEWWDVEVNKREESSLPPRLPWNTGGIWEYVDRRGGSWIQFWQCSRRRVYRTGF